MAQVTKGISGLGLVIATTGAVLGYSALKNASVIDTLRALLKGQIPQATGGSSIEALRGQAASQVGAEGGTAVLGGDTGSRVAQDARAYLGVPYRFGGADPSGFDCSGLVNYVMGHDLGLAIPYSSTGKFTGHGPVTFDYYSWASATTIKGDPKTVAAPGDLICWPTHIGIAVGGGQMIAAPTAGDVVKQEAIYSGAICRRPKQYAGAEGVA